jgi:hypothetical protein
MVRSRLALFLAGIGLLAGTVVGCGSGPEPKDDGDEQKMERTNPGNGSEDKGDEDGDDD